MIRFILFLLVAATGSAQTFVKGHPPIPLNSQVTCASSDTTNSWDNLLEGFQTASTGYENTWTEVGTTANITAAANSSALTTGKPTGACNQAFKLVVPTTGTETYIRWDNGSEIDLSTTQTDVYFSLYMETPPDDGERFFLYSYQTTTSLNDDRGLDIVNVSGTYYLTPQGSANPTLYTISAGQWYVLKFSYDTANALNGSTCTIWSSGTALTPAFGTGAFTRGTTNMRYLFFGAPFQLESNESGTFWFDLIAVKTN